MRHAKIVATLGPAQTSYDDLRNLLAEGVNVARFNMSHGTHADHEERLERLRRAAADSDSPVAVLLDLQGPKIRVGTFADGAKPHLAIGDRFTITSRPVEGDGETVSTSYTGLPGDVQPGDPLLIDDGRIRLRAIEVTEKDVVTEVEVPGRISDHKGINLPGVAVSVPALTEKDLADLRWGLAHGVDWVALSFVRGPEDIEDVHRIMEETGVRLPVMAKLEKPQAVDRLHEIVAAFDGIMVARGDLGVELPLEEVPIVQKRAIEVARRQAKPVVVATQMLESMIESPRPTRAEASDCANAVLDGADALMLSGETSIGAHWLESVRTMARIIEATEAEGLDRIPSLGTTPHTRGGAITAAAAQIAEQLGIDLVCTFTQSGDSVRRMSRLRQKRPVIAFTPDPRVRNQLEMSWGVRTHLARAVHHTDQMARQVDKVLLSHGEGEEGQLSIIVAGSPPGIVGSTNALRVHVLGDAINDAAPAYRDEVDDTGV